MFRLDKIKENWNIKLVRATVITSVVILLCGVGFVISGALAVSWTHGLGNHLVDPRHLDTSAALQFIGGCVAIAVGKCGLCTLRVKISTRKIALLLVFLVICIMVAIGTGCLASHWKYQNSWNLTERVLDDIRHRYGLTDPDVSNGTVEDDVLMDEKVGPPLSGNQRLTEEIDSTQEKLKCCGAVSPLDYRHTVWQQQLGLEATLGEGHVPRSCCVDVYLQAEFCTYRVGNSSETVHQQGCAPLIKDWVWHSALAVTCPAFLLSGVLTLCLSFFIYALISLTVKARRSRRLQEHPSRQQPVYAKAFRSATTEASGLFSLGLSSLDSEAVYQVIPHQCDGAPTFDPKDDPDLTEDKALTQGSPYIETRL